MNENFEMMVRRISPTLRRITYKLNGHFTFFDDDDLFQEALEHLWLVFQKGDSAEKTDSYLLQGCYFYLKNYIRKAMDKTKLISLNAIIDEGGHEFDDLFAADPSRSEEAAERSFTKDSPIIKTLSGREKKIISLSLDGMTVREIGQKLGISHVMVVKIKKRIKNKCARLRNICGGYQN